MLWDIRARMKPALTVIEMIPNVHRTPALAALRKAAQEGRAGRERLTRDERDLAFYDGTVQLISPIGARLLRALYLEGRIKLKKPGLGALPKLEAYIATEAEFRAEVAVLLAEEEARHRRLAEIIADPALARAEEITPALIDKVFTANLGFDSFGTLMIGGLTCHRSQILPDPENQGQTRAEAQVLCWWIDAAGQRQGDEASG